MIRITADVKDVLVGLKHIERILADDKQFFAVKNDILALSDEIVSKMRNTLNSSGYNLNKLADSIDIECISDLNQPNGFVTEIGIGKISKFPVGQQSGASYWEAFDSGFKVTQANIGYFGDNFRAPEAGGYGEKWHHTGKGSGFFFMKPNKVIEPLHFTSHINKIEPSINKIVREYINKLLTDLLKK